MWALGLSIFEIIAGSNPFMKIPFYGLADAIRTWQQAFPDNRRINSDMKDIVLALYEIYIVYYSQDHIFNLLSIISFTLRLKKNVEERPKSYEDILNHRLIQGVSKEPSAEEKLFINRVIESIPQRYC